VTALLGTVVGAVLTAAALVPAIRPFIGERSVRLRRAADRYPAHPMLLPADPTTASTVALCRAWRISYLVLEHARDPAQRAQVAAMRGLYLDELARRDPAGFRRWLIEGARAGGDPAPYLVRKTDRPASEGDGATGRSVADGERLPDHER
jgi:hypothetical protein